MHFLCSLIIYLQISIYSNCYAKISGDTRGGDVWEGEIPGLISGFPWFLKKKEAWKLFRKDIFKGVFSIWHSSCLAFFFFL